MFYVEIVRRETSEVVNRMGPMAERMANRTMSGASINLDHAEYFVRVVPDSLFGPDHESDLDDDEPEFGPES